MNIPWHRLIGLLLKDFFFGTRYEVEVEQDLSVQQQFADIVVLEDTGSDLPKPAPKELPDGFEYLSETNVISFKSMNQPFDRFALLELGGHGVALAKLHDKDNWQSYLDEKLNMFALTTRQPATGTMAKLLKKTAKNALYQIDLVGFRVIVIVLSKAPKSKRNAIWNLFSGRPKLMQFGARNYRWKTRPILGIFKKLYQKFQLEGIEMPYTIEDFVKEYYSEEIKEMPQEERLKWIAEIPEEERLKGISEEKRLKGIATEKRLKGISAEELRKRLEELEKSAGKGKN